VGLYYQIDYSLEAVADDTQYFHAQFRRVNKLPYKQVYTIVDEIEGKGSYVGTYLAHGARQEGWWGEGEVKFYIDGDKEFPTICGTGEEDYFLGSYGYNEKELDGKIYYTDFTGLYSGFHVIKDKSIEGFIDVFGQYRWHIEDPVRFENDLKITIQSLAWREETYLPLEDDLASVAYWYQTEPHHPFPELPTNENLIIERQIKK
jgi:predicted amidohydrolase YtcJ